MPIGPPIIRDTHSADQKIAGKGLLWRSTSQNNRKNMTGVQSCSVFLVTRATSSKVVNPDSTLSIASWYSVFMPLEMA